MGNIKTAILIGGGNSLRNFNFNMLVNNEGNKLPIFAVNFTYFELLERGITADHILFWDKIVHDREKDRLSKIESVHTIDRYSFDMYRTWKISKKAELSREENTIGNMNSIMAMTINIALQLGFNRLVLLGFDNKQEDYEHWYDKQPTSTERSKNLKSIFELFNKFANSIIEGLEENERIICIDSKLPFESISRNDFEIWIKSV